MPKPKLPEATPEQFEGDTLMRMVTSNIKRVRYIDITLNQPLTIIGGDEQAGKTSYIDSFGYCMSGKLAIDMQPIRNGQQEGFVRCDFGDGQNVKLSVTRTLSRVGEAGFTDSVSVKIPGHIAPAALETFLRKLTFDMAFDPHEFDGMSDVDKFKAVQKLIGDFDFTKHAASRKKIFDQRTTVGQDWGREQSAADAIVLPAEPDFDPEMESAITLELQQAGTKNTERALRAERRAEAVAKVAKLRADAADVGTRIQAAAETYAAECERTVNDARSQIADLEEQMRLLQERVDRLNDRITAAAVARQSSIHREEVALTAQADEMRTEADALQKRLDEAEPLPDAIDPAAIAARLETARGASASHAAWAQLRDRRAEYLKKSENYGKQYEASTKLLDEMDAAKKKAIQAAKLPVHGLGVADGYLTLEAPDNSGPTPWDQASESRRADASFELAMAMNPKLKVILIRSGSGISKRTRQRMQERAAQHGYRVILEVVDEGEGTTVVIEDGHVRGQAETAPTP